MIAPVNFYNVDNYEFYLDPKKPGFLSMCLAPELVGVNKDMVVAKLQEKAAELKAQGVPVSIIHQDTPQVDVLFDLRSRRARSLFSDVMRIDLEASKLEASLGVATGSPGEKRYHPNDYTFRRIRNSPAVLVFPKAGSKEAQDRAAENLLEKAQILESSGIKSSASAAQMLAAAGGYQSHPGLVFHIGDATQQSVFNAIMGFDLKTLGFDFDKSGGHSGPG